MKKKSAAAHKPPAVSYSRWQVYDQCPLRFKLKFIEKLPDPQGEAAARGERIHSLAQAFTTASKALKVPPELKLFKDQFKELRKETGWAERMWQFDENWNYLNEQFSPAIYVRVKTDHTMLLEDQTVRVIDYKTGRVRENYEPQLELYAAGAAAAFDDLLKIEVQLWFLDHGVTTRRVYPIEKAEMLQKEWDRRFKPMRQDQSFKPKPGDHCRWCPYRKSEGGPCKY